MNQPNEATTRTVQIDPQLEAAGWNVGDSKQVGLEIPVDGNAEAWRVLKAELERKGVPTEVTFPAGISDYVLYRENGNVLAVVEAKRASVDIRLAEAQTRFYVEEISKRQGVRPFAFLTNGTKTYFWDVGEAPKREVHGFFSRADFEAQLFIRQNAFALSATPLNAEIINRPYQHEAVRRVAEAFEEGRRRALLVMATGTGKTRTAMALVKLFLDSNQARRILFVADRDALVSQALEEGFHDHLPDEPASRIYGHRIERESRLFVVTLQTLNQCFREFTPAFFDLIIFDEVHRSIFNKWNDVVQYFDGRMIGLTATPAEFVDRNTFVEFGCPDNIPTFNYGYRQAIEEGYLVDFDLQAAQTKFQRKGIKGAELDEETKFALIEQGFDPEEIDVSGSDLERTVSNKDTLRRQWDELMSACRYDEAGLIGKTIIFALTQDHALRLKDAFDEMYPQYPDLASVITYKSEYKGKLIDRFKKESQPRIAISVDMLETGVNVPEAVNLVFMRPVQSGIKLAQMIGRGTRTREACEHPEWLPDGKKDSFLILDFWENDFKKDPSKAPPPSLPVLVSVFNTRLKLMRAYLPNQNAPEAQATKAVLREMVLRIPRETYKVQQVEAEIKNVWNDDFWTYLNANKLDFLRAKVGPLLRLASEVDVAGETFTNKVERLKLEVLTKEATHATLTSVMDDVGRLPAFVTEVAEKRAAYDFALSEKLATGNAEQFDTLIRELAPEMKKRKERESGFVSFDLRDIIDYRSHIVLDEHGEPLYAEAYRERVEGRVHEIVQKHPTMQALTAGEMLSDAQLIELERTLHEKLGESFLQLSPRTIKRAYGVSVGSLLGYLRYYLENDHLSEYAEVVSRQFDAYIAAHTFNSNQIRFLRTLKSVLVRQRHLHVANLYEAPLTSFGQDAADRWFTEAERDDIMTFTRTLAVTNVEA